MISGVGTPTNFTFQTTSGKSELFVGKFGIMSFPLPSGDYAFIQSIQAAITVSSSQPSEDNPNITIVSMLPPLNQYLNLANINLPAKEPNDSYTLVTNFLESCNQLSIIANLSGLTNQQVFTNISGRTFSLSRTFNDSALKNIVNATIKSGRGLSSCGWIFRFSRGFLRSYPFPLYSFPVVTCSDAIPTSTYGSNQPAVTSSPWLPKYLRGNNVDEDCDGKTDEELLNEKDDDGDGLVDEDIAFGCLDSCKDGVSANKNAQVEIVGISPKLHYRPHNSYYHGSIVALVVSLAVALWAAAMLLGGSLLWEYHRSVRARRSTSVSPIFEY